MFLSFSTRAVRLEIVLDSISAAVVVVQLTIVSGGVGVSFEVLMGDDLMEVSSSKYSARSIAVTVSSLSSLSNNVSLLVSAATSTVSVSVACLGFSFKLITSLIVAGRVSFGWDSVIVLLLVWFDGVFWFEL